jgi:hypothetical protein
MQFRLLLQSKMIRFEPYFGLLVVSLNEHSHLPNYRILERGLYTCHPLIGIHSY